MESEFMGGDLYQMQQEAIARAKQTAQKANHPQKAETKKLIKFEADTMIVLAVLAVLLLNGCNDMLLVLALIYLLIL